MRTIERYLINRLLDGLSGWLMYKQAMGAKQLYSEYFLYAPIYDIATGRGWSVLAQEHLRKPADARRSIDFVLYRRRRKRSGPGFLFLEVKYLKNVNRTVELKRLAHDFEKLRLTAKTDIDNSQLVANYPKPTKLVLVVAQQSDFNAIARSKSKSYQPVIDLLEATRRGARKKPKSVFHSNVRSKLKKELHWNVLVIGEHAWPPTKIG
jgi:hypothetical protein